MTAWAKPGKSENFWQQGATVVEYAVLIALFALLVIGAVVLTERKINNSFDRVTNELANPPGMGP